MWQGDVTYLPFPYSQMSTQQIIRESETLRKQIEWMLQNQEYQKQRVEVSKEIRTSSLILQF